MKYTTPMVGLVVTEGRATCAVKFTCTNKWSCTGGFSCPKSFSSN